MRTLSGELTDFSLQDVLRFLSATDASGVLLLQGAGTDAGMYLRDGRVCLALADVTRVPLGPRLIATGLADKAAVDAARGIGGGTTFGLACALMRTVGDAAAAATLIADHTAEAVGWLSLGSVTAFELDSTVAVKNWPLEPLATDEVLAAAERCAGQWTELRGVISDLSLVPSCVPERVEPAEIGLTARQWRIAAFVDGHRSVKDVLELTGLGQLDAACELKGLVEAGLLEMVAPGGRSIVETIAHDVWAAGPFAVGQPWFAHGDGVEAVPEPPVIERGPLLASRGPDAPSHADDETAQPPDAVQPDAASDANLRLLNRLIDGNRGF
jgi:hypothetical protein